MRIKALTLQAAAFAVTVLAGGVARADNSPLGVWIDHTGRGAVEIKDCDGKLCGYVAWVKDAKDADGCGEQIIGNVKPVGRQTWDNGWIYDPDRGEKFDVEIKPISADKLRVTGYAGIKWLSETMTWKRAPADLQKCSKADAAAAPAEKDKATTAAATPAKSATITKEAKVETKGEPEAKVESKPDAAKEAAKSDDLSIANDDKEPAAKPDDDTETADADADDNDDADAPKKKGKALAKLAEALNVKKIGGGKCRMSVPYVDMVVTFDCDKQ